MPTIDDENKELNVIEENDISERYIQINKFIDQIKSRMKNMSNETITESEILVIDRFEDNLAICENRETKEKVEIDIYKLPNNIKEGSVIKLENGQYVIDEEKQQEIEKRIEEKMKNIWND